MCSKGQGELLATWVQGRNEEALRECAEESAAMAKAVALVRCVRRHASADCHVGH